MQLDIDVTLEGLPKSYLVNYKKILSDIAHELVKRIIKRTLSGVDANGKSFGNYKDGSGQINLHDTGAMLDSMMVVKITNSEFEIGIGEEYAKYVEKRFRFFAMSKSDVNFVYNEIETRFFDHLLDPKKKKKVVK